MAIDTISRALSGQASTAAKQAKETADSAMEQAIAAVPGAVSDWLEDNVTPTTPVVDASLSIAGAAADAKATGDGIADLKSAFNERTVRVPFTKLDGKGWDYFNNFAEKTLTGYFACSFTATEKTEYTIYARNIGTNTTFAVGFIDSSGTVLSTITNLPTVPEHCATVETPEGCTLVKFTTNNQTTPIIRVYTDTLTVPTDESILYVSKSGSDTDYDGSKTYPFQTIQKAINSGFSNTIIIGAGVYAEKISASDLKELRLIGDPDGGTIIDYSITIAPTTGSSGIKEASYSCATTSAMYRVFVTKDMSMSQTGNATAYTVNLWTSDGTTKLIPKETLSEVQGTSNTWTYDGSNIYVNGSDSSYKLVTEYDDIAAQFSNIQELILRNINIKYAGYINCKIVNCGDVSIDACEFSNSGRQHGLAIEDSNATVTKCKAMRNCYDGFNIHEQGNTTFIDCEAGYNTDDGMSHHDGATGTVIGGYYHHNTKGGISPTYSAQVNCYNAWCHANGYGIYYSTAATTTECVLNGCVLSSNNGYGLRVAGSYAITSLGTLYNQNNSNSKADGGGSITSIGGNP